MCPGKGLQRPAAPFVKGCNTHFIVVYQNNETEIIDLSGTDTLCAWEMQHQALLLVASCAHGWWYGCKIVTCCQAPEYTNDSLCLAKRPSVRPHYTSERRLSNMAVSLLAGLEAASDRDAHCVRRRPAAPEVFCHGALRRGCVPGWPAQQPTGCQVRPWPQPHVSRL